MLLTQKELAEKLKVSERSIQRMRNSGKIHGEKVGGQWRFNSKEIDSMFMDEEAPLAEITHALVDMPISRMLSKDNIMLDMKATNMKEAINELVSPKIFNNLVLDINDLREKCLQREKLLNTGVGNGIAVPHPRDPISTLRTSACLVIGRSKKGIDYSNKEFDTDTKKCLPLDGKPVKLFFLICVQTIELHLHLMAKIALLVRDESFRKVCEKADTTPEDIIRAIMEHERADFMNDNNE